MLSPIIILLALEPVASLKVVEEISVGAKFNDGVDGL